MEEVFVIRLEHGLRGLSWLKHLSFPLFRKKHLFFPRIIFMVILQHVAAENGNEETNHPH